MPRRIGAVLLAVTIAGVSGFEALAGAFWGFTLKCDDTCGTPPPWRDDPDAWQWDALGIVGLAGLGCALLFVACIALGRRWLAFATLIIWAALATSFLILLDESGLTSHAGRGWAGLSAFVVVGLAASALTGRSAARPKQRAASH